MIPNQTPNLRNSQSNLHHDMLVRNEHTTNRCGIYQRTVLYGLAILDTHIKVYRLHKPQVSNLPFSISMLQLEIEVAHNLRHELRYLEK